MTILDSAARLMKTKDKSVKKYNKFAYKCSSNHRHNIIRWYCGVNVVQSPTDHYQLPEIVEQGIENLQMKHGNYKCWLPLWNTFITYISLNKRE